MNVTTTNFFTIWEIDDNGKKATVRMSSSRKVKDTEKSLIEHEIAKNGYVNTNWSFVKFIGKAYNQLKKYEIKSGDRITNLTLQIKQEPYWNENEQMVSYPKYPKFIVWDFELPQQNNDNLDKGPVVVEDEAEVQLVETPEVVTNDYPF